MPVIKEITLGLQNPVGLTGRLQMTIYCFHDLRYQDFKVTEQGWIITQLVVDLWMATA